MNIPTDCLRIFPDYKDVFYGDIEAHERHFLPLCSLNLKFIDPHRDQWMHMVSVIEIFDACVGDTTTQHHTQFTKADTFAFDVKQGKYCFDASWDYFQIHENIETRDYDNEHSETALGYAMNLSMYELKKAYFRQHGELSNRRMRPGLDSFDIESLKRLRKRTVEGLRESPIEAYSVERIESKIGGVLDDIMFKSAKSLRNQIECGHSIEYLKSFSNHNFTAPVTPNGDVFEYIASMEGYDFQKYAADQIYLFHDQALNKAIICLEYT